MKRICILLTACLLAGSAIPSSATAAFADPAGLSPAEQLAQLNQQLDRWKDPDYVATQARIRLQMVRVGEKIYIVKSETTADPAASGPGQASWLNQLWTSVQAADNPPQP